MNKREKYHWLLKWYDDNKAVLSNQSALVSHIKQDQQVETIIRELYLELFNKSVSGCGNCLADAFAEIYHFPSEQIDKIMECKFKLHSGAILIDSFNRLPIATSANLTDDIALAYLKDNPARKDLFQVLPDNVAELVENFGTEASNGEGKENVSVEAEKPAEPRKSAASSTKSKKGK